MTTGQAAPAQRRPELQAVASSIGFERYRFTALGKAFLETPKKTTKQPPVAPKVEALLSA